MYDRTPSPTPFLTGTLAALGFLCVSAAGGETRPWPSVVTWKPDPRAVQSGLYIAPRPEAGKEKVIFTVKEPSGVARKRWAVRGGLPLYRGQLKNPTNIRLLDARGKAVDVQGHVSAYWPEGEARFLCIDFLTDLQPNEEKTFTLEYGTKVKNPSQDVHVAKTESGVSVDTGAATFAFKPGSAFLDVKASGPAGQFKPLCGKALVAENNKGEAPVAHALTIDRVALAERGPVQATVHLMGHYGTQKTVRQKLFDGKPSPTKDAWRYPVSIWFRIYKGTARAYVEFTFGYNADEYSEYVTSYGITLPTGMAKGAFHFGADDKPSLKAPLGVRLNQWAHDQWTLNGKEEQAGKRITGWAAVEANDARVQISMREAFQNWPVAFRADENGDLTCEIMGEKAGRALDLVYMDPFTTNRSKQKIHDSHSMENGKAISRHYTNSVSWGRAPGLRKIHELLIDFAPSKAMPANDVCLAFQQPLVPWPGRKRFKDTCALGHIGVWGDKRWKDVETYFSVMYDCLPLSHETNGLYGWVDWGDLPLLKGAKGPKFVLGLWGAEGWSNGERALAPYFWHYAAGAGRRFLDIGRAFVHHTLGLDVEHEGGDYKHGNYHRHDQVHWRERNPQTSRQSGYRGWHAYHWLTGDPEVKRLAITAGADAHAYRRNVDIRPTTEPARVRIGGAMASIHYLAHCCWVTTGDWHYARANHAISKICLDAAQKNKSLATTFLVENHEPAKYSLDKLKPGGQQAGYFYTYGGDDLLLEWASLTGDPAAVDAILAIGKHHENPKIRGGMRSYHSPEALYLALAFLDPKNQQVYEMVKSRGVGTGRITKGKMTTNGTYTSAADWHRYGVYLYNKNGFAIHGARGLEFLHRIRALEVIEAARETQTAAKPD